MAEFAYDVFLVRYGEIGLKGRNRPRFESALVRALRRALADIAALDARKEYGRIVVEAPLDPQLFARALERLTTVFGVVSVSPAKRLPLSPDAIREAAAALVKARRGRSASEFTFKVEARRPNKGFEMTTPQINADVGAHIARTCPGAIVDVHRPEIVVHVEVRTEGVYVYSELHPGPGGLPVGSSSRALLLLSGGIDSPVAGWSIMKRGVQIEAVHFHSPPFTSERSREKVIDLARVLSRYAPEPVPVHVVRFSEVQQEIRKAAPPSMGITLMRRMMLRIADRLARSLSIPALVTGESVGQVASQTLESMATINAVTNMPILRPLVAHDKSEIVELARRIGTYETSILPYEDCCTLFVPEHPETRPRLDRAERAEEALDVERLVEDALARVERVVPA